jgi:membrane protein DedA with SNARE-associated domain
MDLLGISFDTIEGWLAAGGYVVLFGLLFACGLGLPMPEDIPLIIAGALIAKGQMTWAIAGTCAWCGIIGGDCMLYYLSRKYGMNITKAPLIGKHVTRERIEWVQGMFERYGVGVVAICRLFAGIRGAMVIAAGVVRFNFIKFLIADGIAALISGGLFMLFGWWVGQKLTKELVHEFKEWFILGAIVLAIGFVLWIIWKRRHPQASPIMDAEEKVVEKIAAATHHEPREAPAPKQVGRSGGEQVSR